VTFYQYSLNMMKRVDSGGGSPTYINYSFAVPSDDPSEALQNMLASETIKEKVNDGYKIEQFSGPNGEIIVVQFRRAEP
jgi:hypothetical protein